MSGAKKLLLVSYFYPPNYWSGGAARPYWFARLLPRANWDVTVFTAGGPAVDDSYPDAGAVIRTGKAEIRTPAQPGVHTPLKTLGRMFLWPDSRRFWLRETVSLRRLAAEMKPNLILACAPPYTDLLLAERVCRETGTKLAVDLWDPWKEDIYRMYPTRFHRWLTARAEARIFSRAAFVSVINPAMADSLRAKYPDLRVMSLPFGFDPDEIKSTPLPRAERFHLAYLGSFFGDHKRPEGLFPGLARLPDDLPVRFSFVGAKSDKVVASLRELSRRFPVQCLDYLPHREAVALASSAHALLVLVTRGPSYGLVSTGKVYEALAFGRAVIGVVPRDAWVSGFIAGHGGYMADPDEPDSVRSAFEEMVGDWQNGRLRLPDPGKVAGFRWENIVAGLAAELDGVVS